MSAKIFELFATVRDDMGKGASRRLRRKSGMVPAIIYGGNEMPLPVSIDHNKVIRALGNDAFYSHILTLDISGKKNKVILKDLQRHHYKKAILHMDFQRVSNNDVINIKVPLHFIGQESCPGVKAGGLVTHQLIDAEIRCKVKDLPECINVDLSKLGLNHAIHLNELTLPEGVELHTGHAKDYNPAVASVHLPRALMLDTETEASPVLSDNDADPQDKTNSTEQN